MSDHAISKDEFGAKSSDSDHIGNGHSADHHTVRFVLCILVCLSTDDEPVSAWLVGNETTSDPRVSNWSRNDGPKEKGGKSSEQGEETVLNNYLL